MFHQASSVFLLVTISLTVYTQDVCKDPVVEKRLLADDVRFASPFYVIALPRNTNTEQMDNICYTYFENNNGAFFHVISVTYKNGSNTFFAYTKGDIANRMGVAEATALADSQCVFHDYTLKPICNSTVFILYRCFLEGNCGKIDIGISPGVDVRVVLAANPIVSSECIQETQTSLNDTSTFKQSDFMILPQKLKPQCVTKYNDINSIGYQRAVGSKQVKEDNLSDRFGGAEDVKPVQNPVPQQPVQATWNQKPAPPQATPNRKQHFNPYGTSVASFSSSAAGTSSSSSATGYAWSQASQTGSQTTTRPGFAPVQQTWGQNNGQWKTGPSPWNAQTVRPGTENHFHMWQSPTMPSKVAAKNPNNVYYHVHSWDSPPPGCCRCN